MNRPRTVKKTPKVPGATTTTYYRNQPGGPPRPKGPMKGGK